jgi:hypothetical protein
MIKNNNTKHFSFHLIFVMLLFLMLVFLSVMIIMLGRNIYSEINSDRTNNYEKRVSLSYVANKIRQNDKKECIKIEKLNGENAVVISEVYDGIRYETWIYFHNNAIYEMFVDAGMEFNLDDGMKVLDVEGFAIEMLKDNLYKFTVISNTTSTELILNLNSY